MNIQTIEDVSDCVPLYLPHSLYLKPMARLNMTVTLPVKITGKSISNYDIMERMRNIILPDRFSVLRVSKSTIEFIRFEAELESRSKLRIIIDKLDGRPIKLPGFSESVRIKAAEAKDDFPSRHDWDSFFRDAPNMDEMKAGERPDTIHFINLPIKWFAPRHHENDENVKPSESIFKRIFEKFGTVTHVDVPICDPYRSKMKAHISGMKTYSFEQDVFFEGYVQFAEYIGFVKAMDEFRAMRLVRKDGDTNSVVNIKVNFDKTKHLSDNCIKRRKAVRERLLAKDREREELEMKKQLVEAEKMEKERRRDEMKKLADLEQQRQREQKRKEKHLKKLREREVTDISSKIRAEEVKLMETQRKLESVRLLEGLFDRITLKLKHKEVFKKSGSNNASTLEFDLRNTATATEKEQRHSITSKYKEAAEDELHKIRLRVKKARDDNLLKNFLGQNRSRSSSMVSISSNDSILSESKRKKKKKKKNDSDSSEDEKDVAPKFPPMYPGMMPMPEGMDWSAWYPYMMSMGGYFPSMGYRPYRGRGRGRGGYRGRGRGGYYGNDYDGYGHDDRDRHSRSYSRSRSRSRGRYRRKRRSRSRSRSSRRSRRSRSRSRSKSRSKSRSRSQSRTKKLVSTRRSRSWSSKSRSRSHDHKRRGYKRRSTWSREASPKRDGNTPEKPTSSQPVSLQPEKLLRSAREIQRSVQQKLKERLDEEESMRKSILEQEDFEKRAVEHSSKEERSPSADSAKFISPKRAEKSQTPDKLYSD